MNDTDLYFENLRKFKAFSKDSLTYEKCLEFVKNSPILITKIPQNLITQELCNYAIKMRPELISEIPKKFMTQELCKIAIMKDATLIEMIPKEVMTKELYHLAVYQISSLITVVPAEFQTQEMWIHAIKMHPDFISKMPTKFITQEVCNYVMKEDSTLIRYIPKEFITSEMKQNILHLIFDEKYVNLITYIPKDMITQEMCDFAIMKDPTLIRYIPKEFITSEMKQNILHLIFDEKYVNLITYIPKDMITQEMCDFAIMKDPTLIRYIPRDMITQEMCDFIIENNYKLIKYIPKYFITPDLVIKMINSNNNCEKSVSYALNIMDFDVAKRTIERIIDERPNNIDLSIVLDSNCLTSELAEKAVLKQPNLIDKIPSDFITDEMIENIKLDNLYESDIFNKLVDNHMLELSILKELTIMLASGGSVESLAKKHNIPIEKINVVIEKQKDKNPELYMTIKNKLSSNQTMWLLNMVNDCNMLSKIIVSLGHISNAFLDREQKIKFAYLFYKNCSNSLEDIYTFANKYPNEIENFNSINIFFRKVLKYNYLKNENTLIPEKKTIIFNNRWLKAFDINDYFKIKDGMPTVKNQYMEHMITVEDVNGVISILKDNGIPLNDMIVKETIREYYKGTLVDYINHMQSFDEEIVKNNVNGRD